MLSRIPLICAEAQCCRFLLSSSSFASGTAAVPDFRSGRSLLRTTTALNTFAAGALRSMTTTASAQGPLPQGAAGGTGVSDEELKSIGSKALDTLECRDLKQQTELVLRYYRKDARFVDNIMDVSGHDGILLQFASLIKYFKDVKLERQPAKVHPHDGSGTAKVEIMNHQHYIVDPEGKMAQKLFPGKVELDVQTVATIDLKTKQIVNHAENWQGKSAPPEALRKISGSTTCWVLRLAGLNKEVDVKVDALLDASADITEYRLMWPIVDFLCWA